MKEANVAVEWAMEIADSLPERYQEAAFAELLRHALRCELNPPNASLDTSEGTMPTPATGSWQEEVIAGLPEDHLVAESGTRDQQVAWAIVKLWHEGIGPINKSIRERIKIGLGLEPPDNKNTSHSLQILVPKFVQRKKREKGQGYEYVPTRKVLEIFEGFE